MGKKIVATSDLHLGQSGEDNFGQFSLLSHRADGNLVQRFAQEVIKFADGDKVTLVLVGDVLDLSLAYMQDCLEDLGALLKPLKGVVDKFVYVIGNHDHHLFSLHCEEEGTLKALRRGELPRADDTNPTGKAAYHITSTDGAPFDILTPFVHNHLGMIDVRIAYPSYVEILVNKNLAPGNQDVLYYFNHGHLTGGLYTALSDFLSDRLKSFPHERSAATVNHTIIEAIYWLLGETGEGMGANGLVEQIYTDLQKGSNSNLKGLVARFAEMVLPGDGAIPALPGSIERKGLVWLIMNQIEKYVPKPNAAGTSSDRHEDVTHTRTAMQNWINRVPLLLERPKQFKHIIYGHTHVRDMFLHHGTFTTSWNLGTWLVEPSHPRPRTGFLGIREPDTGNQWLNWIEVK